jgi:hypothetical protein
MHEIYTHTVFEPSAKKIPSLLFMLRKERSPFYGKSDNTVFPEVNFVPEHISILSICRRFASYPIFVPLMRYDVDVLLCKMI